MSDVLNRDDQLNTGDPSVDLDALARLIRQEEEERGEASGDISEQASDHAAIRNPLQEARDAQRRAESSMAGQGDPEMREITGGPDVKDPKDGEASDASAQTGSGSSADALTGSSSEASTELSSEASQQETENSESEDSDAENGEEKDDAELEESDRTVNVKISRREGREKKKGNKPEKEYELDPDKIRLMTRITIFEKEHEHDDLVLSKYYREDYVRYGCLRTIIVATLTYWSVVAMYVLYRYQELLREINSMDYFDVISKLMLGYFGFTAILFVFAFLVYHIRFQLAKKGLIEYNRNLKKFLRLEERDEGRQEIKQGIIRVSNNIGGDWEDLNKDMEQAPRPESRVPRRPEGPENRTARRPEGQENRTARRPEGPENRTARRPEGPEDRTVRRPVRPETTNSAEVKTSEEKTSEKKTAEQILASAEENK